MKNKVVISILLFVILTFIQFEIKSQFAIQSYLEISISLGPLVSQSTLKKISFVGSSKITDIEIFPGKTNYYTDIQPGEYNIYLFFETNSQKQANFNQYIWKTQYCPELGEYRENVVNVNRIKIKKNRNFFLEISLLLNQDTYGFKKVSEKKYEDFDFCSMIYFLKAEESSKTQNLFFKTMQDPLAEYEKVISLNKNCLFVEDDIGRIDITIRNITLRINKIDTVLKGKDPDGEIGREDENIITKEKFFTNGYIDFKGRNVFIVQKELTKCNTDTNRCEITGNYGVRLDY